MVNVVQRMVRAEGLLAPDGLFIQNQLHMRACFSGVSASWYLPARH
jgi:hypothetical protein